MLATSSVQGGPLSYALLFACALVGWAGVPAIGTAAIGTTAVLASQGQMSIVAVLVVASAGAIAGGLVGYAVGHRWGVSAMERPGRRAEQRRRALAKGEGLYDRWGWVAVFFTPSWMAGVASMRYALFVPLNSLAAVLFVLATGLPAYGVGKVSTGHTDTTSIAALVGGLRARGGPRAPLPAPPPPPRGRDRRDGRAAVHRRRSPDGDDDAAGARHEHGFPTSSRSPATRALRTPGGPDMLGRQRRLARRTRRRGRRLTPRRASARLVRTGAVAATGALAGVAIVHRHHDAIG